MIGDNHKKHIEKDGKPADNIDAGLLTDVLNLSDNATIILKTIKEEGHAVDFNCVFINRAAVDLLGNNITGKKLTALCFTPVYNNLLTECQSAIVKRISPSRRILEWDGTQTTRIACKIIPRNDGVVCFLDKINTNENEAILSFTAVEQLLKNAFNASGDIIILLKCIRGEEGLVSDFKFLLCNKTAEAYLKRADLKNKTLGAEYPQMKKSKIWDSNITAMVTGTSSVKDSFGNHEKMMFTATALNGHFIVLTGTTEINDDNKYAADKKRLVEELVNRMTHDIKNPLSAISLASQLIEEKLQENTKTNIMPLFTIISRNARKIEHLLGQFLHIGKEAENNSRADICDIIENALDKASDHIVLYDCKIEKTFSRGFMITGSMQELMTAFLNIIITAIESTEIKKGELSLAVFQHPDKVLILIKDNGCGMEPAKAKHIFDASFAGDNKTRLTKLYYARNILRQHGADAVMASEPGNGSLFTIVFKKPLANN